MGLHATLRTNDPGPGTHGVAFRPFLALVIGDKVCLVQHKLARLLHTSYPIHRCRDRHYLKIINLFDDNRKSGFSLRQIALMGHSEDKKVGEWFGPNTIAQVLK